MLEVDVGDRVKDRITGFTGVIESRTVWLNGCARVAVKPEELDKDGKPKDAIMFDVTQLDLLQARVHDSANRLDSLVAAQAAGTAKSARQNTGGPRGGEDNIRQR